MDLIPENDAGNSACFDLAGTPHRVLRANRFAQDVEAAATAIAELAFERINAVGNAEFRRQLRWGIASRLLRRIADDTTPSRG